MTFLELVEAPIDRVEPVDCPACPFNMSCISGTGGTGWKFDCCGSATFQLDDVDVFVDCGNNQFERHDKSVLSPKCLVCTGSVMAPVAMISSGQIRGVGLVYLPTVHARVGLPQRLVLLRERYRSEMDQQRLARAGKNEEG